MGRHSGRRLSNNGTGSNFAAATESFMGPPIARGLIVRESSDPFITKVTEECRFRNSRPTITSAQSFRITSNVQFVYSRSSMFNEPVTLPSVLMDTSDEDIPINIGFFSTDSPNLRVILWSTKFTDAPESMRISTGKPSKVPCTTADSKLTVAQASKADPVKALPEEFERFPSVFRLVLDRYTLEK